MGSAITNSLFPSDIQIHVVTGPQHGVSYSKKKFSPKIFWNKISSDSGVSKISSKDDLQTIEEDDLKIFSNTIDTFPPKVVFSGLVQQPHPQRVIYLTRVFNNNMNTPTPSWQASHLCCLVKYLPVVPRYERDIPLGYVLTSPVTYHTMIYHIECDMFRNLWYTTTRWRPATYQIPPWYITLLVAYHCVICHGGPI